MSLRRRILVGVGVGVGAALALSGVLVYVLAKRSFERQFDDALQVRARTLSMLIEREVGEAESEAVEDLPAEMPAGEGYVVRIGERVIAQAGARYPRTARVDKAGITLAYGRSTAELDATVARLRGILVGVGAAALLLVVGLLAWIARVGLRPVDVLAADIATAELATRISEERPAELVIVAKRLNELLARIDRVFARERALTTEVAHELRTPLAGLRATIEVALDRERTPERYREALVQSLAITKQTERLMEAMLSLAKLDAGAVRCEEREVELDVLVRDVLAARSAQIAERELAVATHVEASRRRTDPTLLAGVLHNLLDNAIGHGEPRGTIVVDVEPAAIRITNTGCTLTDTSHVFERFWRGDAARSDGAHAGLGLAIAKGVCETLGLVLTAEARDGKFIATVHFRDER